MKLVEPLKREPGGAATLTVFSSLIVSFVFVGPRLGLCGPVAGGSVAFSIPLGLIVGRPGPPLRRAFSSRSAATVRCSSATCSNSATTKFLSSVCERASRFGGGTIPRMNLTRGSLGIVKSYRHAFCPFNRLFRKFQRAQREPAVRG